ncbi:hypothetical protein [Streptomyces thermolilacinus]|uniref:hypothetical protein n=1 Tax=Streptomyces thermolilacinus TaxID=285540 RepID=UPI0033F51EE4
MLRGAEKHRTLQPGPLLLYILMLALLVLVLGLSGLLRVLAVLVPRRLPVVLALKRPLSPPWRDALFLGWYGPIGVSALFHLTMEAHRLGADPRVLAAGTRVVAVSTVVHGVTTAPGPKAYGAAARRAKATARDAG